MNSRIWKPKPGYAVSQVIQPVTVRTHIDSIASPSRTIFIDKRLCIYGRLTGLPCT